MYQIKERHTLPAQLRLDSLVSMILCLLLEHQYTLPNTSEANALRHQAVLLEADAYLRNHIGENVDLDKLAQSSLWAHSCAASFDVPDDRCQRPAQRRQSAHI